MDNMDQKMQGFNNLNLLPDLVQKPERNDDNSDNNLQQRSKKEASKLPDITQDNANILYHSYNDQTEEDKEKDGEELGSDDEFKYAGDNINLLQRRKKNSITREMESVTLYINICKRLKVPALSQFVKCLKFNKYVLNLKHVHLSKQDFESIFIILRNNTHVRKINLEDTKFDENSIDGINYLIKKRSCILELNLADNKLNDYCTLSIAEILKKNGNLTRLNLSRNRFQDSHIDSIANGMLFNNTLLNLNLSFNRFGECCEPLAKVISTNNRLEKLNLSWNYIRGECACAIANSLIDNTTLQYLNLSFNGFGDKGAKALGYALRGNSTLVDLDIQENRITNTGAYDIGLGLSVNKDLRTFNISNNLITASGVQNIMTGVIKSNSLAELQMLNLSPDKTGLKAIEFQKTRNHQFIVEHGVPCSVGHNKVISPEYIIKMEVFDRIRDYLFTERLRMSDLFSFWDRNKDGTLSMEELLRGLNQISIPVTKPMLKRIFRKLDEDKSGYIDFSEFIKLAHMV